MILWIKLLKSENFGFVFCPYQMGSSSWLFRFGFVGFIIMSFFSHWHYKQICIRREERAVKVNNNT